MLLGIELPLNVADPFLAKEERFWQARLMPEDRWKDIPRIQHDERVWADRLKEMNVDFAAYDLRPHDEEASVTAAQWAKRNNLGLMLNNPYCQINGKVTPGLHTWSYNPDLITRVARECNFLGVVYDELIHHQVHPNLEGHTNPWNALADVSGMGDSLEAYDAIEEGLQKLFDKTKQTGFPSYTEQVVPAFFHAVARAGGRPGCKILKEQLTPITTSLCMSAALQYKTQWMGTIDLWEGDSGPWYQVMAKQSGHGVPEFINALKLTALLNPSLTLLEAADLFWDVDTKEGKLTEFGEAVKDFTHNLRPRIKPAFDAHSWMPTIAFVHAEDGCWNKGIKDDNRFGFRMGSKKMPIEDVHRKWLRAWYHLTWGKSNGSFHFHLSEQKGELAVAEKNYITGSEHDMKLWPLEKRRDETRQETHMHSLFHPLNNVAVFDAYVTFQQLRTVELIILCGSYCLPETLAAVLHSVKNGAVCLCQAEIAPLEFKNTKGKKTGEGYWFTVDDFDSTDAVEQLHQYKGFQNQWILKSKLGTLRIWATDKWGNEIDWEVHA